MLKRTFLTLLIALLFAGKSYSQDKVTVDKVVAVVGNSIILYSEVEDFSRRLQAYMREMGYTSDRNALIESLERLMEQKLLYNQALIDSIEIDKISIVQRVDEYVGQMVVQAGSVQALEEQYHLPIYEIKKVFSSTEEEREYAQMMERELNSKVKITPGEVERYYKKLDKDSIPLTPVQYVYAQITKYPSSSKEAKFRAREQLLSLRGRILEGTRFDLLARMYSEDEETAIRGGELEVMNLDQLEQPFAKALEKLQPGQVSEVVETAYGYHIIELIEKRPNLYRFRHILVRPKFTSEELLETNKQLDSLARAIRADSVTFEKAALEFSDDSYSKYNGGLVSNLEILSLMYQYIDPSMTATKHIKEELPVADYRVLDKMQPGEVSDAFSTQDFKGNQMGKILKLLEIIPSHPANLKEDYLRIEALALEKKTEEEYRKWIDKKIEGMFIRIAPEFRIYEEFDNKSWLK